jgi:hypothetical protein
MLTWVTGSPTPAARKILKLILKLALGDSSPAQPVLEDQAHDANSPSAFAVTTARSQIGALPATT